jgi:hypothetical protein
MFNRTSIAVLNCCQAGEQRRIQLSWLSAVSCRENKRGAKIFGTEDLKDLKGFFGSTLPRDPLSESL